MRLFLTQIIFVFLAGIVLGAEAPAPAQYRTMEKLTLDQKVGLGMKIVRENPKLGKAILLGLVKDYKDDFEKNKNLLSDTYSCLGDAEIIEAKDTEKAILWHEKALSVNPANVPSLIFKGRYFFSK